jgi:hypothetical protein
MYSAPGDWNNTLKVINELIERSRRQESSRPKSPESYSPSPEPPPDLILLRREQLESWIAARTDRSSPPIFQLAVEERPFPKMNEAFYRPHVTLKRLYSGAFEMNATTPREANFLPFRDRFLQDALQVASEADARDFNPVRASSSDTIVAEFRTFLSRAQLPVLGPGGRVTVYREPENLHADVVVRSTLNPITAQWRPIGEIVQRVRTRLEEHKYTQIHAGFGYFELSKYDRQSWLRPAFVFLLDIEFSANRNISWRETIVEAASTTSELGDFEGLGAWTA